MTIEEKIETILKIKNNQFVRIYLNSQKKSLGFDHQIYSES